MQKLYYSISEASKIADEEQHILRYWEKEFEQLKPKKNRGGNRIYSEKDIMLIKLIKKLLRDDKLSIKGAKEQLSKMSINLNDETLFPIYESIVLPASQQPVISSSKTQNDSAELYINKKEAQELYVLLKEVLELIS